MEASETTASRFVAAVEAEFRSLLHAPLIGPKREQFGAGLRLIFHSPYAIYYLATGQDLVIVRVLHGARDTTVIAAQRGFEHDHE